MKTLLITMMLLWTIFSNAQESNDFEVFFNKFKSAVIAADVPKLKTLIYPFKDEVEDMQAGLIEKIAHGNKFQTGDGAFSLRALDSLIAHHLDKIHLIEKETFQQLARNPIFGKVVRSVGKKHIYTFEHKNTFIVFFKTKKTGIQLFFWENLNSLLRE
ncbi:MAG TPA: hypothetical protein VFM65_04335 [Flavobacteriaceae bacterium]|nr:hypothetical protein [Flavobacteriaceae bacterium]